MKSNLHTYVHKTVTIKLFPYYTRMTTIPTNLCHIFRFKLSVNKGFNSTYALFVEPTRTMSKQSEDFQID